MNIGLEKMKEYHSYIGCYQCEPQLNLTKTD